jgi:hypothetical protein
MHALPRGNDGISFPSTWFRCSSCLSTDANLNKTTSAVKGHARARARAHASESTGTTLAGVPGLLQLAASYIPAWWFKLQISYDSYGTRSRLGGRASRRLVLSCRAPGSTVTGPCPADWCRPLVPSSETSVPSKSASGYVHSPGLPQRPGHASLPDLCHTAGLNLP